MAAAKAESTMEKLSSIFSIKNVTINTKTEARQLSRIVMTTTLAPFFGSVSNAVKLSGTEGNERQSNIGDEIHAFYYRYGYEF